MISFLNKAKGRPIIAPPDHFMNTELHKFIDDIRGNRYGRLTVVEFLYSQYKKTYWICVCDCGTMLIRQRNGIIHKTKYEKSCGCSRKEHLLNMNKSKWFREKKSREKRGKANPQWRGDKVGYAALHEWVKRYKEKSDICNDCGKKSELLDLANISQEYKRDLKDWEWLCRRCHMIKDGRLENFVLMNKERSGNL